MYTQSKKKKKKSDKFLIKVVYFVGALTPARSISSRALKNLPTKWRLLLMKLSHSDYGETQRPYSQPTTLNSQHKQWVVYTKTHQNTPKHNVLLDAQLQQGVEITL